MDSKRLKGLTFSYDDGDLQDKRLVELFNKYGMKATFNLNSELLGKKEMLIREGHAVLHDKLKPEVIKNNTGVRYCRTIISNHSFDLQDNL